MRPCHEFPFSRYHSSKKQVYIPISSKPIDPECDKTASLVSSLSFFFASFKCDITSVTVALFARFSFTHHFIYCITVREKNQRGLKALFYPVSEE